MVYTHGTHLAVGQLCLCRRRFCVQPLNLLLKLLRRRLCFQGRTHAPPAIKLHSVPSKFVLHSCSPSRLASPHLELCKPAPHLMHLTLRSHDRSDSGRGAHYLRVAWCSMSSGGGNYFSGGTCVLLAVCADSAGAGRCLAHFSRRPKVGNRNASILKGNVVGRGGWLRWHQPPSPTYAW